MKQKYTLAEIKQEIEALSNAFEVVRLVDPIICEVCSQKEQNGEFVPAGCFCFEVWNKNERCKNCISALALSQKARISKFEYIGDTLFYIIARYVEVDGNKYSLECVSKLSRSYTNVLFDENDRSRKLMEMYNEVRIDSLTGLYNRKYVVEKLQPFIIDARVNKNRNPVLAYLDMDHLKVVNDNYGHLAGDALIVAVANTMINSLEQDEENFVAHMSGDEFVICFGNSTVKHVKGIIEKLLIDISRTAVTNYPQLKPSISAGIADFAEANTYDTIMELSDRRMRKAKKDGGNKVVIK